MEFARRGPATAAADGDASDGRRFPDPPPHGDAMLVIRDALQAQLQKDRRRQEIIEAELAKIERAIALRSANVEPSKPSFCSYSEVVQSFVPHRRFLDPVHDLKKGDGRHGDVELKSGKPAMEYRLGGCSRPCCSNGKAGQENAASDGQKLHESNRTLQPRSSSSTWELTGITVPVKQPKALKRWSCAVCQVEATSERNLQDHFAGQKHQANVASSVSRNNGIPSNCSNSDILSSEMARHKMLLYFCKVCDVQCSSESMFTDHRKGKKHRARVWKLKGLQLAVQQ
ncbi:hypothetical protein ACP70R_006397 [Stipagrostis hirtigluma subsp. patula]